MEKLRFLFAVISFFAMIVINALANSLSFNGLKTGEVSSIYSNNFVPAGFTFSIWGLIYLWLLIFVISLLFGLFIKGKKNNVFIQTAKHTNIKISWWFTLSNVLNSLWIVLWHHLQIGLSLLVMLGLLLTLIKIYKSINEMRKTSNKWHLSIFVKPFSLYLGWISVATIANTAAYLTSLELKSVGWVMSILKIEWPITYAIVFLATALASIFVKAKRDFVFSLVIAWALFGITMRWVHLDNTQTEFLMFLVACIVIIVGLILTEFIKKKKAIA
ncbi:MAG: hypothetical protein JXQ87_03665 [Bacteroidia bacterium]